MSTRPPYLPPDITCAQMGPEAFTVEIGDDTYWLKQICRACPGYVPCRDWALEGAPAAESIIIGGTTHRERQKHRAAKRKREAAEAAAAAQAEADAA